MADENNDEIVLQMSVRRHSYPPRDVYVSIDIEPANKRVLLAAMKFMADKRNLAVNYLDKNIDLEELR